MFVYSEDRSNVAPSLLFGGRALAIVLCICVSIASVAIVLR